MEFDFDDYIKDFFKIEFDKDLKKKYVDVFEQMAVHTRKFNPGNLLNKARPNEENKITEYRIANYRPITYGSINKSFDDVYRAVGGANYSIENADELTKEYINQNYFDNNTLEMYLQKRVLRRGIEDPNGFLVWLPSGVGLTEQNERINPTPSLVYSSQLHFTDFENVFSYLSTETNIIKDGERIIEGKIYYIFTKTNFYKYIQIAADETYQIYPVYNHNIGQIPMVVLGGDINDNNFYNSFFSGYLAYGDEAICAFSDWQAQRITSGFPIIEEFVADCEIQTFVNKENNPIPDGEEKFQGVVKSVGERTIHKSPYGITLRKIPSKNATFDDSLDASIPSRRYIAPLVDVAKYAGEVCVMLIKMAEESLQQSLSYAGDSGKKVELTNEGKYSMLTKICNNYFNNIYRKSLIFIESYLKRKTAESVSISMNIPMTFTITTESDIIAEIAVLKTNNVPAMYISESMKDLSKKRFAGNPVAQKISDLIIIIDPLFTYSIEEKLSMQLSNTISQEAFVISVNAYGVFTKIVSDLSPETFLKMTNDELIALFNKEIQEYMPENETSLKDDNGNDIAGGGGGVSDENVGKIPLAIQQLALAAMRAKEAGDEELYKQLKSKQQELIDQI